MPRRRANPHPIPYQGSKRRLANSILRYFPTRCPRLVEPFAGSAAISIAVAAQGRADAFWLNDAHSPLMSLWYAIIETPTQIASDYEQLWLAQSGSERTFFLEVRDRFNQTQQSADFLYLLARCVKAAIRYNSKGQFNNTADNRRKGAHPSAMRRRILTASQLFRGHTKITSLDYRQVLADCTTDDLIYMDPPYQGVSGPRDQRYMPSVTHEELCDTLAELTSQRMQYAVSYDGRTGDQPFGKRLPEELGLTHIELPAGRSSQATLLGRDVITYESFYLSPALSQTIQRQGGLSSVSNPRTRKSST